MALQTENHTGTTGKEYPGFIDPATGEIIAPRLGLVCITNSEAVRFRTITRTRYLALPEEARSGTLEALYRENFRRLMGALTFCIENKIRLYRLSSANFPMSDLAGDPTGDLILQRMAPEMAEFGEIATANGIRVVMHPDQFVVLNSTSPQVVENSIKTLEHHAWTMDLLGLPQSAWASLNIHGGKGGRAAELIEIIPTLAEPVRNRLALENDEHAYGAWEILEICQAAHVPMIFDVHHHVCHEGLTSLEDPSIAELLALARETWPRPEWQLTHLSNGRTSFADPAHHDYITTVPSAFSQAPWIEVEAKHKEEAIRKLREIWPLAE
ncbi:MAG: UV DNA damage repair endonuclease UvsE [Chloroflexi bacterium]|nr:UV DNA damage repair endonuclease UvsE [Chloroflexota bacterium]